MIPPKKVITPAGIELESPRSTVCSADHSATRPKFFKNYINFYLFIAGVLDDDGQHLKARNLIDAGDGRCDDDGVAGLLLAASLPPHLLHSGR